ncbi:MAG: hypothetical protein GYA24_22195 [Candidatus Lokiarchaeota archaeon]|nr:hypothetical protein [Candidatus Lokiarchaeota archaeon]
MARNTPNRGLVIFWIVILAIPAILIPALGSLSKQPPAVDKLVMANLYTWYGTPTRPAGQRPYSSFQRHGAATDWAVSGNMTGIANTTSGSAYVASGNRVNSSTTGLKLSIPADAFPMWKDKETGIHSRIYFALNVSVNNASSTLTFSIKKGGTCFSAAVPVSLPATFTTTYLVFPFNFTSRPWGGANELALELVANGTGSFSVSVASMSIGTWQHYQEDYHTYYDTSRGAWLNDPPFSKATDKNVHFTGNVSDALGPIPAYGNYSHPWAEPTGPSMTTITQPAWYLGIYDSLDPVAIEAQLRLMWWAGIDVVMLMHPWDFEVARAIMDVAWSIRERFEALHNGSTFGLRFIYYGGWDQMSGLLYQIKAYEHYEELYLLVNGGPAFYVGFTGLLEEPYATYANAFDATRQAHPDVFMVGDGYLPPKEEMLDLLDGFYFYDTSGLMRQGYGDPRVTVYQQDGSPSWGQGKLHEIFGASSRLIHAHGGIYAATVIPGTDNTCVHDFDGKPLYDGRPGTIVERVGGLTFNNTWQCSMAAGANWITITSWNELHEGTEIEPTAENGTFYIALCKAWASTFKQA